MNLNFDPQELAKFDDRAHRWWDIEGEFRTLHQINPLRLQWIQNKLNLKNQRVIDVGCGGGILSDAMAVQGAHVLGIDLSVNALKVAQLHALEATTQNVIYRNISIEDIAIEMPHQFDALVCMEMLEHVPDPFSIVEACAKVVKPGGWLFFSTLNRNLKSFALGILAAEYLLKLLPAGTHEWAKFIKPNELARYCRASQLVIFDTLGIDYNVLTQHFSTTKDLSVNYMIACRKLNE